MDERPTHLDLFSGIGGFALAAQWAGFKTIGFCEIDKYCQKVLAKNFGAEVVADAGCECVPVGRKTRNMACSQRATEVNGEQRQRLWNTTGNGCPIIPNIFDLDGREFAGVDLITGGFPCQPFSVAGKRRGTADDRAIWPEMLRVISEARPAWVLGENVPGIIPMELDNVLSQLEGIGYATRSFVIPACAVDARHRRDRVWIVGRNMADTSVVIPESKPRPRDGTPVARTKESRESNGCSFLADAGSSRQQGQGQSFDAKHPAQEGTRQAIKPWDGGRSAIWLPKRDVGRVAHELSSWLDGPFCTFPPEPNIPRVAHGVKNRADRLKGLGNSVLVRLVYEILKPIHDAILLQSDQSRRT